MCDSYSALLGWLSHARCPPPWPFSPGPGGHLPTRGASLLAPTPPAREATSLREVPASLPLLPRAREAAPHTRCQPPRPYSRGLAEQATLLLAPSSADPWRRSDRP